jgi:hypothetical protein
LPWAVAHGVDSHQTLAEPQWQAHLYGAASPELSHWCWERKLPLHVFSWTAEYGRAGIMENAVYLIRPDTYVGLADPTGSPGAIERYLAARGLSP